MREPRHCGAGTLIGAALLATSTACVTAGSYESLAAQEQATAAERDELRETVRTLEERLEHVSKTRDALAEKIALTELEVEAMRDTYEGLVKALEVEVRAGQIQIQRVVDGIRLAVSDELLFPSGSAALDASGREVLLRVAEQISDESAIVSIEGHTDDVPIGPALKQRYASNWELAAARAAGVARLLAENGVSAERLRAVSRGSTAPVASNDTAEGRAANRRTEILLRPIPKG